MHTSPFLSIFFLISSTLGAPHSLHRRGIPEDLVEVLKVHAHDIHPNAQTRLVDSFAAWFQKQEASAYKDLHSALVNFAYYGSHDISERGDALIILNRIRTGSASSSWSSFSEVDGSASDIWDSIDLTGVKLPEEVPNSRAPKLRTMSKEDLAATALGTAVVVGTGAGLIALALGHHKNESGKDVVGSGQTPEEGALSEADETTLLTYIKNHPDDYDALYNEIQALPQLSVKERELFTAADPKRKGKRSLLDMLD